MALTILTDSCYWLGLVSPDDQHHTSSLEIAEMLDNSGFRVAIPWPCMYESLRTRLTNKQDRLFHFELLMKKPNITFIGDEPYREVALEKVFDHQRRFGYTSSLVDYVIIELLNDPTYKFKALVSFNSRDFSYPCSVLNIPLYQ